MFFRRFFTLHKKYRVTFLDTILRKQKAVAVKDIMTRILTVWWSRVLLCPSNRNTQKFNRFSVCESFCARSFNLHVIPQNFLFQQRIKACRDGVCGNFEKQNPLFVRSVNSVNVHYLGRILLEFCNNCFEFASQVKLLCMLLDGLHKPSWILWWKRVEKGPLITTIMRMYDIQREM